MCICNLYPAPVPAIPTLAPCPLSPAPAQAPFCFFDPISTQKKNDEETNTYARTHERIHTKHKNAEKVATETDHVRKTRFNFLSLHPISQDSYPAQPSSLRYTNSASSRFIQSHPIVFSPNQPTHIRTPLKNQTEAENKKSKSTPHAPLCTPWRSKGIKKSLPGKPGCISPDQRFIHVKK